MFSRKEALAKCPEYLKQTFVDLFRQIDELDMMINFYDLAHGKRKNPPRDTLVIKFNDEELRTLRERSEKWNQYTYLKNRHRLVELRREQYTLRDSFLPIIPVGEGHTNPDPIAPPAIDVEIEVLPLGTNNGTSTAAGLFRAWEDLHPWAYTSEQLQEISDVLWKK